ncbi:glycosyltransferase [Paraglaciecola sp.]|uniref:glycosyltransferase n=1 Tax=Paraglaciecola sp. TaxID=1920173 RepID=UPI00273E3F4A|nr:glycosyltransferase [Paraglaciecola sp.]MDP5030049.1 glycosyltransferase [Paraglaciecola sp.]
MSNKVLFLHKCFVKGGGVERVHQNLSAALQQQNINTCFFVLHGYGESEAGYNSLQNTQQAQRPNVNAGLVKKLKAVFDCIKANEIGAIIAATEQANMVAFLCKLRFPRLNIVYTRHCAFDVSDQKLPPWAIKLLYSLYAMNGQIVGVSKALQQQIKDTLLFNKKAVHFVPNAVVDDSIYLKAETNSDNWQHTDYLVAVGRLVEQKGFDLLLNAYAQALRLDSQLPKLMVIGEGEDKSQLVAQAAQLGLTEHVFFTGFTTNPYYAIKRAKAFILSSRHEGMPTVLVESMALNTPVIAFDCPTGPSELIVKGKNGVLVPHLDVAALALAISQYQNLPQEDISHYVQDFCYPKVANAYLTLCEGNT